MVCAKYPLLMNGKVKVERIKCFIQIYGHITGLVGHARYISPFGSFPENYVMKFVILCNYIVSLSLLTSVENVLFYYQTMENEF